MSTPRTTIARLRWNRGLTQRELAKLTRLSVKTIEKVEAGTTKGSPRTAIRLAGALAVDVDDIVTALLGDYRGADGVGAEEQREMMDAVAAKIDKVSIVKPKPVVKSGAAGEQDGVEIRDIAAGA